MNPTDSCTLCKKGYHMEYFPDNDTAHEMYDEGEVVRIKESIFNLVQNSIIKKTAVLLNYTGFKVSTQPPSYEDYRKRPALLLKPREVTTLTDGTGVDIESTIFLFATFDGRAPLRTDLPRVLQKFCVPISPHSCIQAFPKDKHIHTTPEWSNSRDESKRPEPIDAWLIVREHTSRGHVDCRWGNAKSTTYGSTFAITSWETWEDIHQEKNALWKSWLEECKKGRDVLKEYQREYLECLATLTARQEAIRLREEAANTHDVEMANETAEQRAVRAHPGTNTAPQRVSPTKPSPQEGQQPQMRQATPVTASKSFASVLAGGSQRKITAQTQTTSGFIHQRDSSAAQQLRATRPSTTDRLKALFVPNKDPVNERAPETATVVPRNASTNTHRTENEDGLVNLSSDDAKKGAGDRVAVPA